MTSRFDLQRRKSGVPKERMTAPFSPGRIACHLKKAKYVPRIGAAAPIYLAAVLDYLSAEMLQLAGDVADVYKVKRIAPRHVALAVRHDTELGKLFDKIVIKDGGVQPHIHNALLKGKNKL